MMDSVHELARRYAVTIHPDPHEPGYVADAPDFPGVCAGGTTPAEALECAYEGIASIISVMLEDGHAVPEPPVAASPPA